MLSDSRIRRILGDTGSSQGSQDSRFACSICPKSLKTQKSLERQLLVVHNKVFVTEDAGTETMDRPVNLDIVDGVSTEVGAAALPKAVALPQHALRVGGRRRSISLQRHKGRRK